MDISLKSMSLLTAVALTGLSAGLFYAWSVSVIPGTRRVTDLVYLETMQSINRAIINPAFFLVFFGSLILLAVSSIQHYPTGLPFWLLLTATIAYLVGTFGVTALGNVPLNNVLDALSIGELSPDQMAAARQRYEVKWNRLHLIRTVFALLSFLLSLLAVFSRLKTF